MKGKKSKKIDVKGEMVGLLSDTYGLSEKKAKRLVKHLNSLADLRHFMDMSPEKLDEKISRGLVDIKETTDKLEENSAYREAVEIVKDCKSSLKETVEPTKVIVDLCVAIREYKTKN